MQNVGQSENQNRDKVNVQLDVVKSSTPQSYTSSPAKSETETFAELQPRFMTDSSESEEDSVSEVNLVSIMDIATNNYRKYWYREVRDILRTCCLSCEYFSCNVTIFTW